MLNCLGTMPWRHMEEWRHSSTILDLDTSLQLVPRAPAALPPGERAPGDNWLGDWVGRSGQSGRCGEDKNVALPGIEPGPSSPSLYWQSYPGSESVWVPAKTEQRHYLT
jgi:hypothetical protein